MKAYQISGFADEASSELSKQIDILKHNGIKYIEIRGVNDKNIVEHTIEEVKDIKQILNNNNIEVSSIGSPIGKISIEDNYDEHIELFKHTLRVAEILESPYIRIFSFYIPIDSEPLRYRDKVMTRLEQLVELARDIDIILLHENEKGVYGDIPERCLEIFDKFDGKIRAVFDPANFVQCDVIPYPDAYNLLSEYIEYMHIKDVNKDEGKNVVAGDGDGCIPNILASLYSKGYDGFLSLEPHLGYFTGLEKLEPEKSFGNMESSSIEKFNDAVKGLQIILSSI